MSASYYIDQVRLDRLEALRLIYSLSDMRTTLSNEDFSRLRLQISFILARLAMNRRSAEAIERMNPTPSTTRVYKPARKYKRISATVYEAVNSDPCAICIENQKKGDTITTGCNHSFCKPCWNSWMDTNKRTCPCCRNECKSITVYSIKK